MKAAVIYYSFEGNCAMVAGLLKEELNADVFEIKTADSKKRTGFAKFLWGGAQVVVRKKPELLPLDINITSYDMIILGTPVWAASPAPALFSFLDKTKIEGKKIALFCCHAGGKGKALEKFRALLSGNTIVGEIDFNNPASGGSAGLKQKVSEWIKTF